MAYGDGVASIVGEKYGKRRYKLFADKSLEGSAAMFLASFLSFTISLAFFSLLYSWRRYDYVIFVRYLMGTAYLPSPLRRVAYHFFAFIVPISNFMFFLDVKPEEAYRRIQQVRKRREMFESLEELERVRFKALSLALMDKWIIINANKPARDIEKQIRKSL